MIQVRKRDGHLVEFDLSKIKNAILKDLIAIGHEGDNEATAQRFANEVFREIDARVLPKTNILEIEHIQDMVVDVLAHAGETRAVIAYCEYRYQHKARA